MQATVGGEGSRKICPLAREDSHRGAMSGAPIRALSTEPPIKPGEDQNDPSEIP
jgi:hypothetical protein